MKRYRARHVVPIVCALVTLSIVAPNPAQAGLTDISVTGRVTDPSGRPLENVHISDGNDWTLSDSFGAFSIDEALGSSFTLSASKPGLATAYKSATALVGTTVEFQLYYVLSATLSPNVFNNNPPKTLAISVTSYAPTSSCVTWTNTQTGSVVSLSLANSVPGGESTWNGSYAVPAGTADGSYSYSVVAKDLCPGTQLSTRLERSYIVDSSPPILRGITPIDGSNASVSPLKIHALVQDFVAGVDPLSLAVSVTDLGTASNPSSITTNLAVTSFRSDVGLLEAESFSTQDMHRYSIRIAAADKAGNTLSTTSSFLSNRWTSLGTPELNISTKQATQGDLDAVNQKRQWTFPEVSLTSEAIRMHVSGSQSAGWGTVPVYAYLRDVIVRYKVAGSQNDLFYVPITQASPAWPGEFIFGQQVALIDTSTNLIGGADVTAQRATVDLGSLTVNLPVQAEEPTIDLNGAGTYIYGPGQVVESGYLIDPICVDTLTGQRCTPGVPDPNVDPCLKLPQLCNLPATDWIKAYVTDDEAATSALITKKMNDSIDPCITAPTESIAYCYADKATSTLNLYFPTVLAATEDPAATGKALPWVELSQLAWWQVGLPSSRPDPGSVPLPHCSRAGSLYSCDTGTLSLWATSAGADPTTQAQATTWFNGICQNAYCSPASAFDGWTNYSDVALYGPNAGQTQASASWSSSQNGEKCVDSNGGEQSANSKKCKQLASLWIVDSQYSKDSPTHYLYSWVTRTRGFIDGPEENLGIGGSAPDDSENSSFYWNLGTQQEWLFAFRQRASHDNYGGCHLYWDTEHLDNVSSGSQPCESGYGGCSYNSVTPFFGWGLQGQWKGTGVMGRYSQGWYYNEATGCSPPNYSVYGFEHRIVGAGIQIKVVENTTPYQATPAPVRATFVHRWTPWSQGACKGAVLAAAMIASARLGRAISIASLFFSCDIAFGDKNWKLVVGPAKGKL